MLRGRVGRGAFGYGGAAAFRGCCANWHSPGRPPAPQPPPPRPQINRLASLFASEGITVDGEHAIGLNDNIRVYRYTSRQKFGKHIDDSVSSFTGHVVMGFGCLLILPSV